MNEIRSNPDTLLDYQAHKEVTKHGLLKIFFGTCAGVGKTYAMLSDAHRRLANERLDAFIGIVETHGREEVAKLMDGIPGFPLMTLSYRGVTLKEFDLNSTLARKPDLVLIDELAHTNASGARHPKRWQDVEEILAAGIDVYTTLNVQHLESLNDIVANITGIQVRETVPDTIFDAANDIAVIDTPPDEILKRLKEGKVCIAPEVRQRALDHFFKKGNLIALRELMLRRAADRVDAQMTLYSAGQGIREPSIAERVLVCVGHDALSETVIRHASRMATRFHAPWTAVYAETSRHWRLGKQAQKMVEQNLRLAEQMGAKIKILKGGNATEELIAFARDNHITRIIVGRPLKSWLRNMFIGSLADKLIHYSENIEITVVPSGTTQKSLLPHIEWRPRNYVYAVLAMALCTALGLPLRDKVDAVNFGMVYLVGVMAVAARFGLGPSIAASLLGVTAFNFFFTRPYYSLNVYDPSYFVTFFVLLVAGIIISSLASRLRLQAMFFRERDMQTQALYGLTGELAATHGREKVAEVACKHIRHTQGYIAAILLPDEKGELIGYSGSISIKDTKEDAVARWCFEHQQPTGLGTATMPSSGALYLPLIAGNMCMGVLRVKPDNQHNRFTIEETGLLETFANLTASALQRTNASQAAEQAKVEAEAEKLRNMLLSSVSHDLRTPLASVRGSIEAVLESSRPSLSGEAAELLESARNQSERLTRMVNDLLAINRLETGKPILHRQAYFIDEVIGAVIAHAKSWLGGRELKTEITQHLPLVNIDGALIEQVLMNLLENAVKYTPEDGSIKISAEKRENRLQVSISDNGCGIPRGEEQKIFDKFYRVPNNPAKQGSGLGLAICKAVIVAHGGIIQAQNNRAGGLTISFTLPLDNTLPSAEAGVEG